MRTAKQTLFTEVINPTAAATFVPLWRLLCLCDKGESNRCKRKTEKRTRRAAARGKGGRRQTSSLEARKGGREGGRLRTWSLALDTYSPPPDCGERKTVSLCPREAEKKTSGRKRPVSSLLREKDIGSSPILTELHCLWISTDVIGIPRCVANQSAKDAKSQRQNYLTSADRSFLPPFPLCVQDALAPTRTLTHTGRERGRERGEQTHIYTHSRSRTEVSNDASRRRAGSPHTILVSPF